MAQQGANMAGALGATPQMAMGAAQWQQVLTDAQQARTIYAQIMADAQKQQMDRWKIQQDMQTKIFETIQDVTIYRAKTADKAANNVDAYIRG
jgi:hypothetical protein